MHFITGGYFNGKAKWVRDQFGLSERSDYLWLSAYQSNKLELPFQNKEKQLLIIEGVEQYIKKWIDLDIDIQIIRAQAKDLVEKALNWEQAHKNNELILIGTDISKGIVPIEKRIDSGEILRDGCIRILLQLLIRFIWFGMVSQNE